MFVSKRTLALYAFAIPLALILGYLVSLPDFYSFAILSLILLFFAVPLVLKWHHFLLIIFLNSAFNAFFLPGQPSFWLLLAALSFGVSFLNYLMFQKRMLRAPEMTWPLFFLAIVVLGTAVVRGGIGIRAVGGTTYGGRNYVYILGAIVAYFALTAQRVPTALTGQLTGAFFLSGTTYVLSNIAYTLGPAFYFLFYLLPSDFVVDQAASDSGTASSDRIQGLAPACVALLCFLLMRYGIRGLFDWAKPWRFVFLIAAVATSFFGGFRSILILLFLIFSIQFYLEGLIRTRYFLFTAGFLAAALFLVILFSEWMPHVVQRAVSFLPVKVDSEVRADAEGSTDWRLQMWSVVWKDVPKYLLVGKGYSLDPTDMFLTTEAVRMGLLNSNEEALLAGDYHSGPLSVLIPFGIFGALAFLWVLGAGGWILYSNYQYGGEALRRINRILFSYYLAYAISFFFIFGAFNSQLYIYLGTAGLSVSLNGGVKRSLATRRKAVTGQEALMLEMG